jgi:hypothetical protein
MAGWTKSELRILRPVMNAVARHDKQMWQTLKYETDSGPFFGTFPYHPAAMEMWAKAIRLIEALPATDKQELTRLWRTVRPHLPVGGDSAILQRYSMGVVEAVVERACGAQKRTLYR